MWCTRQFQHFSLKEDKCEASPGYRVSPGEPELEKEPFWREGLTEVAQLQSSSSTKRNLFICMQTHLREHYGHTKTEDSS